MSRLVGALRFVLVILYLRGGTARLRRVFVDLVAVLPGSVVLLGVLLLTSRFFDVVVFLVVLLVSRLLGVAVFVVVLLASGLLGVAILLVIHRAARPPPGLLSVAGVFVRLPLRLGDARPCRRALVVLVHVFAPFHDEEPALVRRPIHERDLLHDDVSQAVNLAVVVALSIRLRLFRHSWTLKEKAPTRPLGLAGARLSRQPLRARGAAFRSLYGSATPSSSNRRHD